MTRYQFAYVVMAAIMLAFVTLQFLLAGIGIFGAGSFEAHRTVGFALHLPPLLMLIAALVGHMRSIYWKLALALLVLVIVQGGLPSASDTIAAFHPLVALIVFAGTAQTLQKARRDTDATAPRRDSAVRS